MRPPTLSSTARCCGLANSVARPPSASASAALAQLLDDAARRRRAAAAGRVDGVERLAHEVEVVLAQPGHAGELGPVGDLVEGQPQPELARREGEALLEGEHVGPDVVHDVLVVRGSSSSSTSRSYWPSTRPAIHPSRTPTSSPATRLATAPVDRAGAGVELVGERPEQPLERADVGVDPAGAVGDPGPGRTGQRAQPGGLGRRAPRPRRWPRRSRAGASGPGTTRRRAHGPTARTATRSASCQSTGTAAHPLLVAPVARRLRLAAGTSPRSARP